ncbi:hypothetical protein KI387_006469, partial [Taxus chinensis]
MNSNNFPPRPSPRTSNPYPLSTGLISIIGAVGSIFLVISYYQLVLKYCACFQRLFRRAEVATVIDEEVSNSGLETSIISKIPVLKYNAEDVRSGTECSVCLTEFGEGELVRLLPKCRHAFHISCIGMWLNTHRTCPLCRADILTGLFHLLSPSPSAPAGHEVEPRLSSFSVAPQDTANAGDRTPLTRSLSTASLSGVPPEGASSSQWYQHFRWSKRASSPSREEIHRSLLQGGAFVANEHEIAVDLSGHDNA